MKRSIFVGLVLVALSGTAIGQPQGGPGGSDRKAVHVVRTASPPTLDGVLDPAEWSGAGFVDDLKQVQPVEYAEPFERTEVYLLYDDDALYVGARLFDTDPEKITANIMRQNSWIVPDDSFFVTLDPFNTGRGGYWFGTNPHGVRYDGVYRNVSEIDDRWDGIYDVAAGRFEGGWIAEFRIPFKTLSFDPSIDRWGLNFSRSVQRKNERLAWASRNRSWDPSTAGLAIGFEGLQQGRGLDIVPSLSYRRRKVFSPASSQSDLEPSLDVFYKLTPALNASVTINTDFSATEVDDRQVNLTRFSLFFPERRDFFLREADIFEFGRMGAQDGNGAISSAEAQNGRPFFSRSIGLGPQGETVDLKYGGKVSGRAGRWEIGALSIRQDEIVYPGASASASIDAATLSVLRARANIIGESTIGFIHTNGNPASNTDNSVTGVDYVYRNSRLPGGRTLEAFGWYQASDTVGLETDDRAMGVGVSMPNTRGFRGGFVAKEFQQNFLPGLGFLSRSNIDDYAGHIGYTYRPKNGYLQQVYSGIQAERIEVIGGGLQSQLIGTTLVSLTNRTGDFMVVRSNVQREVLDQQFEIYPGVPIAEGEYSFGELGVEIQASRFRKVSGSAGYFRGDFFDGTRERVFGQLRWQPSPRFSGSLGYTVNDIDLLSGAFVTRIATLGLDGVFSSSLSWVNLIQYDNVSDTVGLSSRLHWVPEAGREMFVVINHTAVDVDAEDRFRSQSSDAAIKFSYTFRF